MTVPSPAAAQRPPHLNSIYIKFMSPLGLSFASSDRLQSVRRRALTKNCGDDGTNPNLSDSILSTLTLPRKWWRSIYIMCALCRGLLERVEPEAEQMEIVPFTHTTSKCARKSSSRSITAQDHGIPALDIPRVF